MVEAKYILSLVKRISGVDIELKTRKPEFVLFRKVFYLLCRRFTLATYKEMTYLLNQNHTMAIYTVSRHNKVMSNPKAKLVYDIIYKALKKEPKKISKDDYESFKENIKSERKLTENLCKLSEKLYILGDLLDMSTENLLDFKKNRIDPYIRLYKKYNK